MYLVPEKVKVRSKATTTEEAPLAVSTVTSSLLRSQIRNSALKRFNSMLIRLSIKMRNLVEKIEAMTIPDIQIILIYCPRK